MKNVNILAGLMLSVMFLLMLGSARNDSAIMDELAHIPAGFGYVTQLDYRLNPEHPPLLKALAASFAKVFVNPSFPIDTPYWRDDINGQWAQGAKFLYESGNNADKIIFFARLPLIFLAVIFGWIFFKFIQKRFNNKTALLALIFYAFSPTFLTHARFVTTDLGAALGFFIGIISFINFLEVPSKRNILIAGLVLGLAELLKFSLFLLLPVYAALLLVWTLVQNHLRLKEKLSLLINLLIKTAAIGLIAVLIIWIVYGIFTLHYPQSRQLRDASFLLSSFGFRPIVNLDLWMIKNIFLRPLGEYLLGLLMVVQRAAGGNTTYFLGEVSNVGSRLYFPLLYLLKEPLPWHILSLLALWFGIKKIRDSNRGQTIFPLGFWIQKISYWIRNHFVEFCAGFFIVFYWVYSIRSPLNIGIRHVLPTFPFIYLLVAREITEWITHHESIAPQNWFLWLKNIYQIYVKSLPRYIIFIILMAWLMGGTVSVYPHFLSYYNELAGGTRKGYKIAVDSNYDWGQDLKRLSQFVKRENISKIAVDYFGGGSPRYYLGDKFEPWWSGRGPAHGWLAVSASTQMGAFGTPKYGLPIKPENSYSWLKPFSPVAQIGYSIFVYKLP